MGEKFRFERGNTRCGRCKLGVCCQGEGVPEPAGVQFQCFGCNFMPLNLFRFTPGSCTSLGLQHRDDNAELSSTGPEREGVEVPALAETNLRRTKTHKRTLDMFA
ncbi:hypothetical protein GCM10007170_06580 [Arthrobacter liuii]|uniref:Uncharacterized protein n=1 Tax=Arthrobacter liuii TaxID=1476996 RepID=A0ABQ2AG00_9MICC|nr:hypothetical protein GCM10007170_06580 [Arthrobacter liuii]